MNVLCVGFKDLRDIGAKLGISGTFHTFNASRQGLYGEVSALDSNSVIVIDAMDNVEWANEWKSVACCPNIVGKIVVILCSNIKHVPPVARTSARWYIISCCGTLAGLGEALCLNFLTEKFILL